MSLQAAEFSKFRKRIGLYSYKLTKNNRYKNPHAIPLHQRQMYESQGYRGEIKIRDLERTSERPFGRVSNKGRFQFNIEKVPFYNIPDLAGFKVSIDCSCWQLKAYVPHITPKINEADRVTRKVDLDEQLLKDIQHQIENAPKGSLVAQNRDPLSQVTRRR